MNPRGGSLDCGINRMKTLAAALFALAATLHAADWPQWRGPNRTGISEERGLLKEWAADGPKLVWRNADVGAGYGSPSIAGDTLYLISNSGNDNEFVAAYSTADGARKWSAKIGAVGFPNQDPNYPGSRSTVTVDGSTLFAIGSDGDIAALNANDGAIKWKKHMRTDFEGKHGRWAYSESPLIDGEALICSPGGSTASVVALNKNTGETIWKTAIANEEASYSSPVIATFGGVKQYVLFLSKGLIGLDAKTGKLLWRYDHTAEKSPANIPTPIIKDDIVFTASGLGGGGAVRIKSENGAFTAEELYYDTKLKNGVGSPIVVGDHFYGTIGTTIGCVNLKTGAIAWTERAIGPSSYLYADGRLYARGENGDVALIDPTPEAYREKGKFTPAGAPEKGKTKAWAHPALADGRLYIRDGNVLWCYDVKASNHASLR